jgi:hypothetical protein
MTYKTFDYIVIDSNDDDKVIADNFECLAHAELWVEVHKKDYPNSFLITELC